MKLTEKHAIKLLNKGWAVKNDGELNKLQRLIKKAIDSKSKYKILPSGKSKFYFLLYNSWMCCDETKRPTFKLSYVVFEKEKKDKLVKAFELLEKNNIMMFKKTEQGAMYRVKKFVPDKTYGYMCEFYDKLDLDLNKRVENLETILKDHLRLDHNKVDTGWKDGCRAVFANLEDKPKPLDAPLDGSEAVLTSHKPPPLNRKDLVKGKWYGKWDDNCKQAFKHSHFDSNKEWYCSESNLAEEHEISLDSWMWADSYKELTQEELDSFLPEGHEDRSDSKPTDFNTNTKYRKKGDVCLCWSIGYPSKKIAIWNETGLDYYDSLSSDMNYANHQFLGVNILDDKYK